MLKENGGAGSSARRRALSRCRLIGMLMAIAALLCVLLVCVSKPDIDEAPAQPKPLAAAQHIVATPGWSPPRAARSEPAVGVMRPASRDPQAVVSTFRPTIMVGLLVRNSASFLPVFLRQLEKQDYPKSLISFFVRTNNNADNTTAIVTAFMERHRGEYDRLEMDDSDMVDEVDLRTLSQDRDPNKLLNYQGKWRVDKLKLMGRLRQQVADKARAWGVHAMIMADADNFWVSGMISRMAELSASMQIASPMLYQRAIDPSKEMPLWMSAHFNYERNEEGRYLWKKGKWDDDVRFGRIRGVLQVPLVQCTYLVRADALAKTSYVYGTPGLEDLFPGDYEFQVFAVSARRAGIKQYVDTTELWGYAVYDRKELIGIEADMDRLDAEFRRNRDKTSDRWWDFF